MPPAAKPLGPVPDPVIEAAELIAGGMAAVAMGRALLVDWAGLSAVFVAPTGFVSGEASAGGSESTIWLGLEPEGNALTMTLRLAPMRRLGGDAARWSRPGSQQGQAGGQVPVEGTEGPRPAK